MYLLYSSPRRAPFTTMPSTLLLHSDCIARVTESMVVCPMRTTSSVPWHSVRQQVGVGREQQRRAVQDDPVEQRWQPVQQLLHFAQVQQFQRIDHRLAGRHDVQVGAGDSSHRLVQRNLAQQIIRDARAAIDAEQGVHDGTAEIEIRQQRRVAGQVRLAPAPGSRPKAICLRPAKRW